jgi:hypothetical protein
MLFLDASRPVNSSVMPPFIGWWDMKRSEIFILITGVISLTADAITIILFFSQQTSGLVGDSSSPSITTKILIEGLMIYGWFIISWVLIRRAWIRRAVTKSESLTINNRRSEIRDRKANYTIISTGILLLPLQWLFLSTLLPFSNPVFHEGDTPTNEVVWFLTIYLISVFSLAGIGGLISFAIDLLMPIIYEDMEDLNG